MDRYIVQQDATTKMWHVFDNHKMKRVWAHHFEYEAENTAIKLNKSISISWDVGDIRSIDESLTEDQAVEVLLFLNKSHDANIGINWDVIEDAIDVLFGGSK